MSFLCCCVSLLKFRYWSKFHVNVMTGSGVKAIFIYKELNRNLEIVNTPSEFCSIPGDWDELGKANLALSLTKKYWMLQNARLQLLLVLSY